MSNSSHYAERLVLLIMLLALSAVLFIFGGAVFFGILKDVAA